VARVVEVRSLIGRAIAASRIAESPMSGEGEWHERVRCRQKALRKRANTVPKIRCRHLARFPRRPPGWPGARGGDWKESRHPRSCLRDRSSS